MHSICNLYSLYYGTIIFKSTLFCWHWKMNTNLWCNWHNCLEWVKQCQLLWQLYPLMTFTSVVQPENPALNLLVASPATLTTKPWSRHSQTFSCIVLLCNTTVIWLNVSNLYSIFFNLRKPSPRWLEEEKSPFSVEYFFFSLSTDLVCITQRTIFHLKGAFPSFPFISFHANCNSVTRAEARSILGTRTKSGISFTIGTERNVM